MVKLVALASLLLAGIAHAEPNIEQRVGWNFDLGMLPIEGKTFAYGLGLELDQHLGGRWFASAAYHWRWTEHDIDAMTNTPGSAHELALGLRRRLAAKLVMDFMTLFVDGEAGVGAQLVTDNRGSRPLLEAYAGLRFGYVIAEHRGPSPERGIEFDLGARAVAIDHGIGGMFVVTMAWDD
ncbi:MAG TPA: hypothetical protein VFQ65_04655 [Kofleriaceae bacterium]|nr:hypothetical protein [Kofleriaceae bacterium]